MVKFLNCSFIFGFFFSFTGSDKSNEHLYNALCRFLPTLEEYLDKQSDSNCLHYALNSNIRIISEEASRQAQRIPTSMFFKSNGFQDGKQICRIRGIPKHIQLLNADTCLVSLNRSETYIADLYLGYNIKPIVLVKSSVNIEVVRSEIIKNDIMLTLDAQGTLSIWDISHEKKRLVKRASSTRLVETIGTRIPDKYKTSIQDLNENLSTEIKCYHLNDQGVLLMANSKGIIEMRKWEDQSKRFQKMMVPSTSTSISNMAYIHDLGDNHCLSIDEEGSVHIVHFKDSFVSNCKIPLNDRRGKLVNVHFKHCDNKTRMFYLVFEKCCYSLEFWPSFPDDSFHHKVSLLFQSTYTVRCSKLWKNMEEKCFLILGTNKNLLVYDVAEPIEVLWCYTEEPINCLDVYPIDDDDYQLIITAGLENKKVLQIHAVTGDLKWAYDNNASRHFPPNVRLKYGRKEFSVAYNGCGDACAMFAIDSESNLYKYGEVLEQFCHNVPGKVTVLAASVKNCFVGCNNGDIYNFKTGNKLQLAEKSSISYLKVVDNFLLASTESDAVIFYEIHAGFTFSIEGHQILDVFSVKSNVMALVFSKLVCVSFLTFLCKLSHV